MKTLFAVGILLTSTVSAIEFDEIKFMRYMAQYGKQYDNMKEFTKRVALYKLKDLKIEKFMEKRSNFTVGHNFFSDWSESEMSDILPENQTNLPGHAADCKLPHPNSGDIIIQDDDAPASVDWRLEGMVNPVRDQGYCGSCYVFSGITTIESAWAIATGDLYDLSEQ